MNIARGCALVVLVALALLLNAESGRADDPVTPRGNADQNSIIHLDGLSHWLKSRFSESELRALPPGTLTLEGHYCGCYDKPVKHFPYAMVVVRTPKGDLLMRPERTEGGTRYTAVATRFGQPLAEVLIALRFDPRVVLGPVVQPLLVDCRCEQFRQRRAGGFLPGRAARKVDVGVHCEPYPR